MIIYKYISVCVNVNYDKEYDVIIDIKYNDNSTRYLGIT